MLCIGNLHSKYILFGENFFNFDGPTAKNTTGLRKEGDFENILVSCTAR